MATAILPIKIQCGVCKNVCKRGVKVSCCNSVACRNCATQFVTRYKTCWSGICKTRCNTGNLVNDSKLREEVETYLASSKNAPINEGKLSMAGVLETVSGNDGESLEKVEKCLQSSSEKATFSDVKSSSSEVPEPECDNFVSDFIHSELLEEVEKYLKSSKNAEVTELGCNNSVNVNDSELLEEVEKYLNKSKENYSLSEVKSSTEVLDPVCDNSFTNDDKNPLQNPVENEIIPDGKRKLDETGDTSTVSKRNKPISSIETEEGYSNEKDSSITTSKFFHLNFNNNAEISESVYLELEEKIRSTVVDLEQDISEPKNMGVSLKKMQERNLEFEKCTTMTERTCQELRFGAQLELMLLFQKDDVQCLLCGQKLNSDFLILKHIQLKHSCEYLQLKKVLETPNVNVLNMLLLKAIRAEIIYQQEGTFPIPVEDID